MTCNEFAAATGYSPEAVRHMVKRGALPALRVIVGKDKWDISPALVEKWRAKKYRTSRLAGKTPATSVTLYVRALIAYNKKHGTNYSYGEAVTKGVIPNG